MTQELFDERSLETANGWGHRLAAGYRLNLYFPALDCADLARRKEMSTVRKVDSKREQEFANIADAGCASAFLPCRRRKDSRFHIELALEKWRRVPMTTVNFYKFVHKKCPLCPLKGMFLGVYGADPSYLSMLCMGLGRAMAPRSSILLRAGRSVELTRFRGSAARPTLAAVGTAADSSEPGL